MSAVRSPTPRTPIVSALAAAALAWAVGCAPPPEETADGGPPADPAPPSTVAFPQFDEMGKRLDCEWGYGPDDGPARWPERCSPVCAGRRQSPIDIRLDAVVREPLPPLDTDYRESAFELFNNGHTIQAADPAEARSNALQIGPRRYELLQLHFHSESEHTIESVRAPIEMHLVHRAAADELAVVGVFIMAGAANPAFAPIWDDLPVDREAPRREVTLDPEALLPAVRGYYTYSGSLTTPDCDEIVTWYVLRQPVPMSTEQIEAFRAIFDHNTRPVQPLHGRRVRGSGD